MDAVENTPGLDSPFYNSEEEAMQAAATIAPLTTCNWDGRQYNVGDTVCKNGDEYKCGSAGWYKDGRKC
jgi:hypothetical protein